MQIKRRDFFKFVPALMALDFMPKLVFAAAKVANVSGGAVSVRGFNSGVANKLLMLVDGREVCDPLFSGVY